MQGGNQIVETVAFVIKRALRSPAISVSSSASAPACPHHRFGHIGHHFQGIQRPPRIAVDQFGDGPAGLIRQNDILAAVAAGFIVHRLVKHPLDIVGSQRFQLDAGAGEQR
jgi:hypothetical protein